MSSLYNLEPQPNASCILHTTSGDISLELWAQQVPLTCRNFLQLALDGYYDGTIFHRLVPGFILQGGDPTGTGNGGESIYDGGAYSESREEHGIWPMEERRGKNAGPNGVGFKDEFHSRLKFNRRGLLGMANEGPDTNGSQFFLTLVDAPELQGKNTLFGRVAGDTIYNLAKMGEAEVEGDRPLYPMKITSVEVLVNPFQDMIRRARTAPIVQEKKQAPKAKKRKGAKQLLSFGANEEEDGDDMPTVKKAKFDTRIAADVEDESPPMKSERKTEKKIMKKPVSIESSPEPEKSAPAPVAPKVVKIEREESRSPEPQVEKMESLLERTNKQIAELKASMKRTVHVAPSQEKKKSALEQMIPETSIRGRKRRAGANGEGDKSSLALLKAFQAKLEEAPPEKEVSKDTPAPDDSGENGAGDDDDEAALCDLHFIANCQSCKSWDAHGEEDAEDDDDQGWMSHALTFKADKLGKDLSFRKKAEDELVVIDPREKARTLKEEMRAQRDAKAGTTGRAWDQQQNARMARASNLAGRGAR